MSKKKITKTIKIEEPGKPTITLEAETVLPETISDSEIERRIDDPVHVDPVGNLRKYWLSIGRRPCAYVKCTKPLPKNAKKNQKYCTHQCQKDAKSFRWRAMNPKKKMKCDLEYLRGLEKEDFID